MTGPAPHSTYLGVLAMGYVVGIDMAYSITAPSPSGDGKTVQQDIESWLGGRIPVLFRYTGTGGSAGATPLTTAEIDQIVGDGSILVPVFNQSPVNMGSTGTYQQGVADANGATAWAKSIGMPQGVRIAFDVEATSVITAYYIYGLLNGIVGGAYLSPGFILYGLCGPTGNVGTALVAASVNNSTMKNGVLGIVPWSASWTGSGVSLESARHLSLDIPVPSSLWTGKPAILQFATEVFGGLCDQNLVDDRLLIGNNTGFLFGNMEPVSSTVVAATTATTPTVATTISSFPSATTPNTAISDLLSSMESQVSALSTNISKLRSTLGG